MEKQYEAGQIDNDLDGTRFEFEAEERMEKRMGTTTRPGIEDLQSDLNWLRSITLEEFINLIKESFMKTSPNDPSCTFSFHWRNQQPSKVIQVPEE